MDLAARQQLNDLLAKLAQADAGAGQLGIGRHQAKHIALGRIALPAQQEIGAAEVEKREGMALADLGQIEQPPQLAGRRWRLHPQQLVAGFRRGQQVAHRADAADAGGDARHLRERAPLTEGLEAAILHHVEAGSSDLAGVIEVQGDLGVALDAGHRVDCDRAGGGIGVHGNRPSLTRRSRVMR